MPWLRIRTRKAVRAIKTALFIIGNEATLMTPIGKNLGTA